MFSSVMLLCKIAGRLGLVHCTVYPFAPQRLLEITV